MNKKVPGLILLILIVSQSTFGFSLQNIIISAQHDLPNIRNKELDLSIGSLKFGYYGIQIFMNPQDDMSFRNIEESIILKFVVILEQGSKKREIKIEKKIERGLIGFQRVIFKVPKDFSWKRELKLKIVNIEFDDDLLGFYKNINFSIVQGFSNWL
jgi:hypothetical protein